MVEGGEEEPLEGAEKVGAVLVVVREQPCPQGVSLEQETAQQAWQHRLALRDGDEAVGVRLWAGRRVGAEVGAAADAV